MELGGGLTQLQNLTEVGTAGRGKMKGTKANEGLLVGVQSGDSGG